ncbi:MAG: hypothetical protein AB7P69_06680 [Candidatus Binatia bacterium]
MGIQARIRLKLFLTSLKAQACSLMIGLGVVGGAAFAQEEAKQLTARLLAAPKLTAETGFSVKLLVPPGHLYDPLWMLPRGEVVWLNDDGGEEDEKGSRLLTLDATGKLSILAGLGKLLPVTGFDVAPASFGSFEGQIFSLAQAKVAAEGATANHIIQRIDPNTGYEGSVFCTLPSAGTANQGVSGFGVDARFGPEGSAFAGKFFAVTAFNNAIYQVTPDGACTPFVLFEGKHAGSPTGLAFSLDGKSMLVTLVRGDIVGAPTGKSGGIVEVAADGKIADKPLVEGLSRPMGMDIAPKAFGQYAGQIFVADVENIQVPVPMTQALQADGKVYRVADGVLQLVASGFMNPAGVRFLNDKLWVSDINGDFIAGKRELPDGFIAEIGVR